MTPFFKKRTHTIFKFFYHRKHKQCHCIIENVLGILQKIKIRELLCKIKLHDFLILENICNGNNKLAFTKNLDDNLQE
jgi:hypothetical protein